MRAQQARARHDDQRLAAPPPVPAPAPATHRRNVPLVNPHANPRPTSTPVGALLIDRQSGRTYSCTSDRCVIGRERTTGGIVLRDPNVSRRHAELSHHGSGWTITDLNSTNGTLELRSVMEIGRAHV